jgi:hypothetical protein
LKVIVSISYERNTISYLFICSSGGTLRISDISFTTTETESLFRSLIIVEEGGLFFPD